MKLLFLGRCNLSFRLLEAEQLTVAIYFDNTKLSFNRNLRKEFENEERFIQL